MSKYISNHTAGVVAVDCQRYIALTCRFARFDRWQSVTVCGLLADFLRTEPRRRERSPSALKARYLAVVEDGHEVLWQSNRDLAGDGGAWHQGRRGAAVSTTTTPYGVIITETEDSISFRLPSWLADDERARIRSELDEWWVTFRGAGSRCERGDVAAVPISERQHLDDGALVDADKVELVYRLARFDRRGLTLVGPGLLPHDYGHCARVSVHDGADARAANRRVPAPPQGTRRVASSIRWRRNIGGRRDCRRRGRSRNARRRPGRLQ